MPSGSELKSRGLAVQPPSARYRQLDILERRLPDERHVRFAGYPKLLELVHCKPVLPQVLANELELADTCILRTHPREAAEQLKILQLLALVCAHVKKGVVAQPIDQLLAVRLDLESRRAEVGHLTHRNVAQCIPALRLECVQDWHRKCEAPITTHEKPPLQRHAHHVAHEPLLVLGAQDLANRGHRPAPLWSPPNDRGHRNED